MDYVGYKGFISYVLTYFNNPEMMKIHLATWHTYPIQIRERIHFIIVDDCSDIPLHIENANLDLTVLRINDDITWNLPGARNLGADYCKTDWFLMTDTDMLLTAEAADKLLRLPRDDKNKIWNMKHRDAWLRIKTGHSGNMMFLSKDLFWRCWGYDEDFSGSYGGQEGHLKSKLFREGGVRDLEHKVVLINFGEAYSPKVVKDAMCSTPDMYTPEGLARSREIAGRLYNNAPEARQMNRKIWNKNVLRFDWEVAQTFKIVWERGELEDYEDV